MVCIIWYMEKVEIEGKKIAVYNDNIDNIFIDDLSEFALVAISHGIICDIDLSEFDDKNYCKNCGLCPDDFMQKLSKNIIASSVQFTHSAATVAASSLSEYLSVPLLCGLKIKMGASSGAYLAVFARGVLVELVSCEGYGYNKVRIFPCEYKVLNIENLRIALIVGEDILKRKAIDKIVRTSDAIIHFHSSSPECNKAEIASVFESFKIPILSIAKNKIYTSSFRNFADLK